MDDQNVAQEMSEDDERLDQIESVVMFLGQSLVPHPEQVSIRRSVRGESVRFSVQVPTSDLGKVIGRGGRIANAIRTVAGVAGAKAGVQTSVEFSDGRRSQGRGGRGGRPGGNRQRRQ